MLDQFKTQLNIAKKRNTRNSMLPEVKKHGTEQIKEVLLEKQPLRRAESSISKIMPVQVPVDRRSRLRSTLDMINYHSKKSTFAVRTDILGETIKEEFKERVYKYEAGGGKSLSSLANVPSIDNISRNKPVVESEQYMIRSQIRKNIKKAMLDQKLCKHDKVINCLHVHH